MKTSDRERERIVVIGGGFAGLNFIKTIDKNRYDVTLIDRNNFHSFPPLFYQVASGGLEPSSIAFPFRREMRKRHSRGVHYHMGMVQSIDLEHRTVATNYEVIPFDRLVIAAGTTNNFFGNDELQKRVFTLKSTSEALRLRNEIIDLLEHASVCTNAVTRRHMLNFVVIGGGPTGVEIAGALGEMKRYVISREYPELSADEVQITLVEGSDRLLRSMSTKASEQALEYLGQLMVSVKLNTLMESYADGVVKLKDGTSMASDAVIWTAGITGVNFTVTGGEIKRGPGGRIVTDPTLRVEGLSGIYALGDIGWCATNEYPHGWPQLAQTAIQQSKHLALQLNAGVVDRPFVYDDKGAMATVGRNRAVADIGRIHMGGFPAWLSWMFIHLMSLLGMRNKMVVVINWIWAYFTYNTSLRLLIHATRFPLRRRWGE